MKAYTADDFGLNEKANRAIFELAQQGKLTHISVLVNQPATTAAVELARLLPHLSFDLHVCFSEGRPISRPELVSSLVRADGTFYPAPIFLVRVLTGHAKTAEINSEVLAQIEAYRSLGVKLTHINSHQNSHVVPPLSKLFVDIAKKYSVPVRQTDSVFDRLKYFPLKALYLGGCILAGKLLNPQSPLMITGSFHETSSHPGTIYDDWWNWRNQIG